MKKITKITIFLIIAMFVAGMFFACGPRGDEPTSDGGDSGDAGDGGATATHTLTVSSNDDTMGTVSLDPPTGPYAEGSKITITATPKDGYGLVKWSGDLIDTAKETDNPYEVTMGTADANIQAEFAVGYKLTVSSSDETMGTVSLDPAGGSYAEGTEVTITATPTDGHGFVQWGSDIISGTKVRDNPCKVTIGTSDETITAIFAKVAFSEDFEGDSGDAYTITDGESTDNSWEVKDNPAGGKWAFVNATNGACNNDTRLVFTPVDLSTYTLALLKFTSNLSYDWAMVNGAGGPNVHEGGYDMKIFAKEGDGPWTELCHEDSFYGFDSSDDNFKDRVQLFDLSAYAGKSDIAVAFWVIGKDGAEAGLDNVEILALTGPPNL